MARPVSDRTPAPLLLGGPAGAPPGGGALLGLRSLLQGTSKPKEPASCLTSRDTPSPVDPDTVEVLMTFEPDPADLALSSIPGHETFDPRRHRFSEEELKPQPIMKKARKIQVPEEQPSGPETPGGSRRTRYLCGRPSWRRRTPCCGRRWWLCARSCPTTVPCCPATRLSTEPCEGAPHPHGGALLRPAQTCALTPSSLPALWSTGRPAGCPRDVMMQRNTFIFLRKSEPPPSLAGAGRVLSVCPRHLGDPIFPPPPLTRS
uniref:D-box binding PAR bZIP transcription factor n=1 Tax=Equus asinus TaxID=9793 RepID=A0A9L0IMU6_EQUAS